MVVSAGNFSSQVITDLFELDPVEITATPSSTTCGVDNGSIMIDVISGGGGEPYTVVLSPGGQNLEFPAMDTFSMLAPDTYTLTATSKDGCEGSTMVEVGASQGVEITNVQVKEPTCTNFTDGSITVFAQSPVSQELKYILTGQENREQTSDTGSALFANLGAGFYMIQVIDEVSGCVASTNVELPAISPIKFSPPTVTPVTCKGAANGTILLEESQVMGGTAPYTYSIGTNVGFIPVGDPFRNLEAGTYAVTVKDANGCESNSITVVVEPAAKITICNVRTTPAHCPKNDGTIRVFAESTMPLQYALDDGEFRKEPFFIRLAPGKYRVIVNREGDNMSECTTCCVKIKRAKKRREC